MDMAAMCVLEGPLLLCNISIDSDDGYLIWSVKCALLMRTGWPLSAFAVLIACGCQEGFILWQGIFR